MVRLRMRKSTAQQQPFSFFFFEAFRAFLDPDLSFLSFLSFLPEALALPGATAACPPALPGEPAETPATPPGTEVACGEPGTAGAGAGWPLSCAISSGVSVPPAANLAKISWDTLTRAGAATTIGAPYTSCWPSTPSGDAYVNWPANSVGAPAIS